MLNVKIFKLNPLILAKKIFRGFELIAG